MNILVSVSGGRSSAVMAHHIQHNEKYKEAKKLFVFANTGKEREETLVFLNKIDKAWGLNLVWIEAMANLQLGKGIDYKIVSFETASRNGEPFEEAIKHMTKGTQSGVPNIETPYCSSRMKQMPIERFANTKIAGGYVTALGYRFEDMPKRVSWAEIRTDKNRIFPLITDFGMPLTQKQVHQYLKTTGVDLCLPSALGNCDLCWKKSERKLIQAIRSGADVAWWADMERKYGGRFFRGNLSANDLLKIAKDKSAQLSMFDNNGESCLC